MMMMTTTIIIIIMIIQKFSVISFLLLNTRLPERNVSAPWSNPFRGRPPPIRFAVGIVQVKQLPVAHHTAVLPPLLPVAACAFSGTRDAQLPACVPTHAASLSCPLGSGGIHPATSDWKYTTSTLSLYLMHAVKPRYSLPGIAPSYDIAFPFTATNCCEQTVALCRESTKCGLDIRRVVLFPAKTRDISSPKCLDRLWAHPPSYSMDAGDADLCPTNFRKNSMNATHWTVTFSLLVTSLFWDPSCAEPCSHTPSNYDSPN